MLPPLIVRLAFFLLLLSPALAQGDGPASAPATSRPLAPSPLPASRPASAPAASPRRRPARQGQPPSRKKPLRPVSPKRDTVQPPTSREPLTFRHKGRPFQLWVMVVPREKVGLVERCHYVTVSAQKKIPLANESFYSPPKIYWDLLVQRVIVVCLFKKEGAAWKRAPLREAGIVEVRLIDKKRNEIGNKVACKQFEEWLHRATALTLDERLIFEREAGRWAKNARAGLKFKTAQRGRSHIAWLQIGNLWYWRVGLELANTYGYSIGRESNATAIPAILILGGDRMVYSRFFLGIQGFLAPTINFSTNQPAAQMFSLALGLRLDLSGYVALGAGYKFDFSGQSGGSFLVLLSVKSELLAILQTK